MTEFKIRGYVKDISTRTYTWEGEPRIATTIEIAYLAGLGYKQKEQLVYKEYEKSAILTRSIPSMSKNKDRIHCQLEELSNIYKQYDQYEVEVGFYIDGKVNDRGFDKNTLRINYINEVGGVKNEYGDIKPEEDVYNDTNEEIQQLPF